MSEEEKKVEIAKADSKYEYQVGPELKQQELICMECGRQFSEDDHYITIVGSVYLGEDKGLIGGSPVNCEEKLPISRFCPSCLIRFLERFKELDENNMRAKTDNLQKYLNKSLGVDTDNCDRPAIKLPVSIEIPEFLGQNK